MSILVIMNDGEAEDDHDKLNRQPEERESSQSRHTVEGTLHMYRNRSSHGHATVSYPPNKENEREKRRRLSLGLGLIRSHIILSLSSERAVRRKLPRLAHDDDDDDKEEREKREKPEELLTN